MVGLSPGFAQWKLTFGVSPIVFVGGIAQSMPGGQMPIISVTDAGSFPSGPAGQFGLSAGVDLSVDTPFGSVGVSAGINLGQSGDSGLDDYFAYFEPLPGGTLEDFEYGRYPFANQSVAANAVIAEPLSISMLMVCPVNGDQTWSDHLSTITALKGAMDQHATLGGTYTVATPKFIYTNCLLRKFADATSGDSLQPQSKWVLEFEQPLITLQQAQQAQNGLMSKMSSGTEIPGGIGSPSGALSSVLGALPAGVSPAAALSVLSSGVPSFSASALISGVLPSGATMAASLTALSGVIPAILNPSSALQVLSGVVPAGILPAQIPGLLAQLAPCGIAANDAKMLLSGVLPGGVSPAAVMESLGSLPASLSVSGALSLVSGAGIPQIGVALSGALATIGQPLTLATPPIVPAALSLVGAGVPTASVGAFASVAGASVSASLQI